ncbi:DUF4126 family protein [Hymenobacter roseosalivarius]|nr:DUF4126 family protein [Hymenobacter roseosalivarius]
MSQQLRQALALGAIAGMRSMSAPATISHVLSKNKSKAIGRSPLRFLQSPTTAKVLKGVAVSEMAADKLPGMPDRTSPPVLLGRILAGGLAGAAAYKAQNDSIVKGALIGSAVAVAATYGALYLRKALGSSTGLPDPVWAVVEDSLVLKSALAVVHDARRSTTNQLL